MRIIIASDIHGRVEPSKRLEEVIADYKPDRVILLGDFLYNGPRNGVPEDYDPMAVSVILNRFAPITIAVRGNCDSRVDQTMLRFKLDDSRILYLNGFRCDLIHGDLLTSDLLEVERGDILMYGHTHVPMLKKSDGVIYVNPGSISFPKPEFPATYAVMDGSRIEVRKLEDGEPLMTMELY